MPRTRTSTTDLRALAGEDLAAAAAEAGLTVRRLGTRSIEVGLDHARVELDVVATAYATGARVEELVRDAREARPAGHIRVLVADRITADARDRLDEAGWGWLDRRGRLRLRSPGLLVDSEVPASARGGRTAAEPVRGRAGIAVAYRLLTRPGQRISTTRSGLGFAPSTISEALSRLRAAALVDDDGSPAVPELFWALADRWAPERTWLVEAPDPSAADPAAWCVSGDLAAAELGAPIVSTGAVPDLYVNEPVLLTLAARRHGISRDPATSAASIAVAPAPEVTERSGPRVSRGWPVAQAVAVALDLAQDRARGREILDDWSPPERVW